MSNYHIELDLEMAGKLVCEVIREHRSYLLDDLHQIQNGKPRYIFSTNADEDIAEIKAHLDAFTKVLKYFGGSDNE